MERSVQYANFEEQEATGQNEGSGTGDELLRHINSTILDCVLYSYEVKLDEFITAALSRLV